MPTNWSLGKTANRFLRTFTLRKMSFLGKICLARRGLANYIRVGPPQIDPQAEQIFIACSGWPTSRFVRSFPVGQINYDSKYARLDLDVNRLLLLGHRLWSVNDCGSWTFGPRTTLVSRSQYQSERTSQNIDHDLAIGCCPSHLHRYQCRR